VLGLDGLKENWAERTEGNTCSFKSICVIGHFTMIYYAAQKQFWISIPRQNSRKIA
jgi:hypothetical protein